MVTMLLLIDAGNTRIKWAMIEPTRHRFSGLEDWYAQGVVTHDQANQLATQWLDHNADVLVKSVLISNVAGSVIQDALITQVQRAKINMSAVEWFKSTALVGGVRNLYRNPSQLGCDRLAALVGAKALLPGQAVIVASCGTATTIDALTAEGDFIGGLILPGLGVMANTLRQHTAQLPSIPALEKSQQSQPPQQHPEPLDENSFALFADNTQDAIRNGCIAAQASAIERAMNRHQAAHCVLAGGAAGWIAPHLKGPVIQVNNLVLIGLRVAAFGEAVVARKDPIQPAKC
jgi:type III pantothenate kinase